MTYKNWQKIVGVERHRPMRRKRLRRNLNLYLKDVPEKHPLSALASLTSSLKLSLLQIIVVIDANQSGDWGS
jgi:hypothetical protein